MFVRIRRISFTTFLIVDMLASCLVAKSQESPESLERKRQLAYFADESRIDELVAKLSAKFHAQNFVISNVILISTTDGRAIPRTRALRLRTDELQCRYRRVLRRSRISVAAM
jgi:hypothetical protein